MKPLSSISTFSGFRSLQMILDSCSFLSASTNCAAMLFILVVRDVKGGYWGSWSFFFFLRTSNMFPFGMYSKTIKILVLLVKTYLSFTMNGWLMLVRILFSCLTLWIALGFKTSTFWMILAMYTIPVSFFLTSTDFCPSFLSSTLKYSKLCSEIVVLSKWDIFSEYGSLSAM